MHNSIELRYPFLDTKLIELSFNLDKSNLISNKKNKILLRNYVPEYSTTSKKHINSPQTQWFYDPKFKKKMLKICKESPIFDTVLDKKKTKDYFNYFYKTNRNNSFKMWQIYNYDLWLKTFF